MLVERAAEVGYRRYRDSTLKHCPKDHESLAGERRVADCETPNVSKPSDIFPTLASTARTTVPSGGMEHDELLVSSAFDQETTRLAGQMLAIDARSGDTLDMNALIQTFTPRSSHEDGGKDADVARCRGAPEGVSSHETQLERKLREMVIAEEAVGESWDFGGL